MTAADIVEELRPLGSESTRKVLFNHGVKEPLLGVKIEELKKFQKRIKKDHRLALDLYDTGIYDAQYLAGLIADETKVTPADLRHWIGSANCSAIASFSVAWIAAESPHGREVALEWIESKDETTAQAGWSTLSSLVSLRDDSELDLSELKRLLQRVGESIHQQPNHVRHAMNGFVIALGSYVPALTELAMQTGEKIGPVSVVLPGACKVPFAPEYIRKVEARGSLGKKRKMARC
jgi:3-methyladenine DNA glycosylase AlkD